MAAPEPENVEAPATSRPGLVPMLAVGVVALGVGAGVGRLVVAPRLAPHDAAAAEADAEGGDGHGGPAATKLHQFRLDGVIVNPAGTRGTHHLIVSVAFEVPTPADQAALKEAEAALRDEIGALLEQRTMDDLAAAGSREALRTDLVRLAERHVKGRPVRVYLPQYILQ